MVCKFILFHLFHILFLLLYFYFTYWSNFISYIISNQIFCCFCSFFVNSLKSRFCSIYSCFIAVFINFYNWQKAIHFNIFFFLVAICINLLHIVFYFKGPIILTCKPFFNEFKFWISSFNIVNEWGAIVVNWSNCLSGTKVKVL